MQNPPDCYSATFSNCGFASTTLYVPKESITLYQTTSPWSGISKILPLDDNSDNNNSGDNTDDDNGAVEILTADKDGMYYIYNLSGVMILQTKSSEKVNELPAGMYIINGKKVKL